MIKLIRAALWNEPIDSIAVTQEDYEEMKRHCILALPAAMFSRINVPVAIKSAWHRDILQQIAYYSNYNYTQNHLPITVPFVILKGTAAAQYYPHPEFRAMGDIDIMTSHEDFQTAYQQLLENGYQKTSELDREVSFRRNNIVVELHRSFAAMSDPEKAKYLDDLIIHHINLTHILPDLINGVVLIKHVYQHMWDGLGLRQIIDWMMFVDRCLPDEKWTEFSDMIQKIDLETFTITTTRMCEIYLGLTPRKWSADADDILCEQLMEYVLRSGNFGNKRKDDDSISESVLTYTRTPGAMFTLLQKQGLKNWKAARKYKILQPFAWIYQFGRYIHRGLKREESLKKLKTEYDVAKRRQAMFDALGVRKATEKNAVYKDGVYVKP